VTTVLELSIREFSRFANRLLDGRRRNSPVIQERQLGVGLVDEPQSPDVLDTVEADPQSRSIGMAIDRHHPDFMLAARCA
jgi:phage gp37-like protein